MANSEPVIVVTHKLLGWDTTNAKKPPKPVVLTQLHEPLRGAWLGRVANDNE